MKCCYLVYLCPYSLLAIFLDKLSGLKNEKGDYGMTNKGIRKWFKIMMVEKEQDCHNMAPTSALY